MHNNHIISIIPACSHLIYPVYKRLNCYGHLGNNEPQEASVMTHHHGFIYIIIAKKPYHIRFLIMVYECLVD